MVRVVGQVAHFNLTPEASLCRGFYFLPFVLSGSMDNATPSVEGGHRKARGWAMTDGHRVPSGWACINHPPVSPSPSKEGESRSRRSVVVVGQVAHFNLTLVSKVVEAYLCRGFYFLPFMLSGSIEEPDLHTIIPVVSHRSVGE